MAYSIQRIRLNELQDYAASHSASPDPVKPISRLRVQSYLANPNARPDDIVLYTIFIDGRIAAFRTL